MSFNINSDDNDSIFNFAGYLDIAESLIFLAGNGGQNEETWAALTNVVDQTVNTPLGPFPQVDPTQALYAVNRQPRASKKGLSGIDLHRMSKSGRKPLCNKLKYQIFFEYYISGLSIDRVASKLDIKRATVGKYVKMYRGNPPMNIINEENLALGLDLERQM